MKRSIRHAAAIAPALAATACAQQSVVERKPLNIIHIMTDDHSYQTISAYGHPLSRLAPTPNIDRLAAEGVLFSRAYVENSLSTPSRACLMTGLYSHQNGQRQLGAGIDASKTFFSELLKEQGYSTAVVGKWHMQCEPKGFDFYRLLNNQGDYYNPAFRSHDSDGKFVREQGYATELITDHAIEFLEGRDPDRPFCLLVHHKAPHRNWMPEPKYYDLFEDVEFPMPDNFCDDYATRTTAAHTQRMSIGRDMELVYDLKVEELKGRDGYRPEPNSYWDAAYAGLTPEQQAAWHEAYRPKNEAFIEAELTGDELLRWKYQRYMRDYLRCIRSVDDQIGRLLDYLEEHDLMDNTVIVYTSDQGFYMGEHGWFDKRFMYEESFRTPLVIRYPKGARGVVCDRLVQNIDYAPTYLAAAGMDQPAYMSGRPLQPLCKGREPREWREDLYYHYYDYPAEHMVLRHDGVSDGRYKLIHFYKKEKDGTVSLREDELYDLREDPSEMRNIIGRADMADVRARLQQRLDSYREELAVDEY